MTNTENATSKVQVEDFYNKFKEHQIHLGVNIRHRTIFKKLKQAGLKADSKVLEIGCGIGTVSSLILKHIRQGSLVGVDISSESIEVAKERNAAHKNTEFIVNDMSTFTHPTVFDFVVLPDVLEHIPIEQHHNLFKVIGKVTSPNAIVLINYPEPNYLDWSRRDHPEKLQIIDQSLSMQDLLNNCYPHGFKLDAMHSYSLQYKEPDYTCIILKKNMAKDRFHRKSKLTLAVDNLASKLY